MLNWVLKQECDFCCQGRERTLGVRTGEQAETSELPGVLFDESGVLKTCSMELQALEMSHCKEIDRGSNCLEFAFLVAFLEFCDSWQLIEGHY